MLECKTFEVRDAATFIACFAVRCQSMCDSDAYLLKRSGYAVEDRLIIFGRLDGAGIAPYDPFMHQTRTMRTAHSYVQNNWLELESGDVIDVEYILGETSEKKVSERHGPA